MKRVAHILSYFPGQEGLTSFCRGLGEAFTQIDGYEVPIVTFRSKRVKNPLAEQAVILSFPTGSRNPFGLPKEFLDALDSGDLKLDGAVLHGTYSPQVFGQAKALKKRGIPYIFMPHDPYAKTLTRHHAVRKFFFWHLCEKWVIKHAAAIQLLSADHEKYLRARGCRTPVHTLANGCKPEDREFMDPAGRVPGESHDFIIQYLGRLDRNHKGLDLLLWGYAEFLKAIPESAEVLLILSGNDWEDRPFLEGLARELNLGDRIRFTGRLDDHSLAIHSRADLSVLCSRFDGFGLTMVEAMLAGRPVLVSKTAGIAEFVEKAGAGFLVAPDVTAIADGLKSAWSKRGELGEMGKRGQDFVIEHLTWESVARKSAGIYEEVFGGQ